jgi:hypothetical protein
MTTFVRSSRWDDVKYIGLNMRKSDIEELDKAGIYKPGGSLVAGMRESSICLSIEDENLGTVAMFGVVGKIEEPANIWLLGTDGINKVKKSFMRISKEFLDVFLKIHPELFNYVDCKNLKTIAWLKLLGAVIYPPEPYGVKGNKFCRFSFRRVANV